MRLWIFLILFGSMSLAIWGCSMEKANTPELGVPEAGPPEISKTIPESFGPLDRNNKNLRQIQTVFASVVAVRNLEQFNASELQARIRSSRNFWPVLVSGCTLQTLKTLLSSNWAPVVITQSPVGPKHVRVLIGYDDSTERVVLTDPVNYAQASFGYADFAKQWVDPQKACVLIFAHHIAPDTIKLALSRYLDKEEMQSISIRAPRRR